MSASAAPTKRRRLLDGHREHLRGSGLTDETINEAGLFSVENPEEAREILRWKPGGSPPPTPAIAFPYPETDHVRLRPDEPRENPDGRTVKYESAIGESPRLYTPAFTRKALEDPERPIYLTEGEKKGLLLCQLRYAAIAAPGVDVFHDVAARKASQANGEDSRELHPDLRRYIHRNRRVTIIFDSDISIKVEIMCAAARLVTMLRAAGCQKIEIIFLPPAKDGAKQGVDDLFVALDRDEDRFRDMAERGRRTTDVHEALDDLEKRWQNLNAFDQRREINNLLGLQTCLLDRESLESLQQELVRKCKGLKLRDLKNFAEKFRAQPKTDHGWLAPNGYVVTAKNGVLLAGKNEFRQIAPAPINIVGVGADENGINFCEVKFLAPGTDDAGSRERSILLPRGEILGPRLIDLANIGAPITSGTLASVQMFLLRQETERRDKLVRFRVLTRGGWHIECGVFVLGRNVIVPSGDGTNYRARLAAVPEFLDSARTNGNERLFLELMNEALGQGSVTLEASIMLGFAATLLRPLGLRSFVFSIYGESGAGKSASQAMTMAQFGRPRGFMITGDATAAGLEDTLARHRDLPTHVDDTQQSRSRALLDLITYQVGGGRGKARSSANGPRPLANWLSIATISGETPLLKSRQYAGAKRRTLELRAEPFRDPKFAADVHRATDAHYGFTAPMFLQWLARHIVDSRGERPKSAYREFAKIMGPAPDDRARQMPGDRAEQIAVIMTAALLARIWVLKEDEQRAREAAVLLGRKLLRLASDSGEGEVDQLAAAHDELLAWAHQHNDFFQNSARERYGAYIDPCPETGGRRVLAILPDPFRKMARDAELNPDHIAHGFAERGWIIRDGKHLQRRTRQLGDNRPRAYWVLCNTRPEEGTPDPPSGPGSGPGLTIGDHERFTSSGPLGPLAARREPGSVTEISKKFCPPAEAKLSGPGGPSGPEGGEEEEYIINIYTYNTGVRDHSRDHSGTTGPDGAAIQPEIRLIRRPEDVASAVQDLMRLPRVGLDIETVSAPGITDPCGALDPRRNRIRLLQLGTPSHTYVFDLGILGALPDPVRELLAGRVQKAGHNIAFDVTNLLHHFGVEVQNVIDTYAGSVLVSGYCGYRERGAHTLAAIAKRHLNIELPKELGASDWGGELSQAQLEYAARDPVAALLAAEKLDRLAKDQGVDRAWQLENDLVPVIAAMGLAGIAVDREKLQRLHDHHERATAEASAQFQRWIGREINLNSPRQLIDAIRNRSGLPLANTRNTELARHIGTVPELGLLVNQKEHLAMMRKCHELLDATTSDGRIHARFNALGAPTGRMSCSGPNLQALPRDAELRSCFISAPGHRLVVADYSAIELRVLAQHTSDPELTRCFRERVDPHRRTAAFITGKDVDAITKEERQQAKAVNFGFCYGMGVDRFIEYARDNYGVTILREQAIEMRRKYFASYRGVEQWHRQSKYRGQRELQVRTASGRLRIFDDFRFTEYLNTPIQGSAADGAKSAMISLHHSLESIGARIIHMVHDEIILETKEELADEALAILTKGMVDGMHEFVPDIPIEAEGAISDAWAKP